LSSTGEPTYGVEIIARLFNLTPRRVQQLAKDGVIPKAARGEYALAPAVRGYISFLQDRLENPGSESKISLNAERARKTKAEADIAEMEAAKRKGELIAADEVAEAWQIIMAEVRANLLHNVPVRIAALAKAENDETKIKAMVKAEIADALRAMASQDVDKLLGGGDGASIQ
jgi:Phage DNA packaging protein, Nu1 subunit of terminase